MDAQPGRSDTVGLIGLGNLGAPIGEQLLAAGTALMVHDDRVRAMTALIEIGADAAANPPSTTSDDQAAAELIARAHSFDTSVVFGLSGPWGSGKTSLVNMIVQDLERLLNLNEPLGDQRG